MTLRDPVGTRCDSRDLLSVWPIRSWRVQPARRLCLSSSWTAGPSCRTAPSKTAAAGPCLRVTLRAITRRVASPWSACVGVLVCVCAPVFTARYQTHVVLLLSLLSQLRAARPPSTCRPAADRSTRAEGCRRARQSAIGGAATPRVSFGRTTRGFERVSTATRTVSANNEPTNGVRQTNGERRSQTTLHPFRPAPTPPPGLPSDWLANVAEIPNMAGGANWLGQNPPHCSVIRH